MHLDKGAPPGAPALGSGGYVLIATPKRQYPMTNMVNVGFNPASVFRTPSDVLLRDDLSRDDKASILHQWEYDARARETAEEEGMPGQQPDMLDEILSALRALDVRLDTEHSAPTDKRG
jgi:hypothetical protein